jgi:hypothetical protein
MFLYIFSPAIEGIVKERYGGVLKWGFSQNMKFVLVLEKTQPAGNKMNMHGIVI